MILGYNTNGLAHHDLIEAIDLLAAIGYRGVAITLDHGALNPFASHLDEQIERVRSILRRNEMAVVIETGARFLLDPRNKHEPTLVSSHPEERKRRVEFLRRAIDVGCELSASCVSLWSGIVHDNASKKDALERLIDELIPVLHYAANRGMPLGWETEPGMLVDTLDAYGNLLKRLAPLVPAAAMPQLTVDVGHLQCQGETPIPKRIHQWSEYIVNVHIEDIHDRVHEHLMFGDGDIDFPPILAALGEISYNGPVNVELSRHSHCAPEAASVAYQFLAPLITAAEAKEGVE